MENSSIALKAIQAASTGDIAYCKFLSANDTGETSAHQAGIYIAKPAVPVIFDVPGQRGLNKDRWVNIRWQDDFSTHSRFIYYGQGSRNEYRITQFGRGFPFLRSEHTGDLFVLVKLAAEDYSAYILQTEDDINAFLDAFGMSPVDTGGIIPKGDISVESKVDIAISQYIDSLTVDFPSSSEMSATARHIFDQVFNHSELMITNPDQRILEWTDMEYQLFRRIEFLRNFDRLKLGFSSVNELVEIAGSLLNRRKSRAGKSLEHHLAAMFDGNGIRYESQPKTEGNKRPDFIFPGGEAYRDPLWPGNKLIFLGAKTTCKDRWRQVINEANRIKTKHLFTLQQGISEQQITEMEAEKVVLVVPKKFLSTFPEKKRDSIWSLKKFIDFVNETQIS